MQSPNFEQLAQWVHQRRDLSATTTATPTEIAETIEALLKSVDGCKAAVMLTNLFPGCELEILYIPADTEEQDREQVTSRHFEQGEKRVAPEALSAIGYALVGQLKAAGNDMAEYKNDEGAQIIALLPQVRDTVLQALGLSLLEG